MLTSYFARASKFEEGTRLVSISRGTPEWFQGERLEALAPSWDLIGEAKNGNYETYIERYYLENLSKVSPRYIARCYSKAVFLCYESLPYGYEEEKLYFEKQFFCHRHIVADWIRKNGFECKEARF